MKGIFSTLVKSLAICLILSTATTISAQSVVVSGDTICVGDSTTLTVVIDTAGGFLPPYTYAWSPTTNLSCTTCQNPVASPLVTTTYSIFVTDSSGTIDTGIAVVMVSSLNPITATTSRDTICANDSLQLLVTSCTSLDEDFESGTNGWVGSGLWHMETAQSNSPTTSWTYNTGSPNYNFDTGVTNAGAVTSTSVDLTGKNPTDTSMLTFFCYYETETAGTFYDQRWIEISANGGPFVQFEQLEGETMSIWHSHQIDLSIYNGDSIRIRFSFDTQDGIANAFWGWSIDDVALECGGADTTLNYAWSPTNGLTDSTIFNPMASPDSTTTYVVTVDNGICILSDTVTVYVDPNNFVTVTPVSSLCIGDSVTLEVIGSPGLPDPATWTYAWSPAATLSDSTIADPIAFPSVTTLYQVDVSNDCGTYSDTVSFPIKNLPTVGAGADTSFCFGGSVQLSATGGVSYVWGPDFFLSCTACDKTNANPQSDMTYYVTATDSFGCSNTDTVSVGVNGAPVSASSTPMTLCTTTDSVLLEVAGSIDVSDDFDPAIDPSVWTSIVNGTAGAGCGIVSGNSLHFDLGPDRWAETVDFNVSAGGTVDFWLTIGTGVSPCEDADIGEDVVLEYSTNAGGLWVNINTYLTPNYPTFVAISETIPVGAQTGSTRFRWMQPSFSNCACDNWAIDDMVINTIGDSIDSTATISWSPGATLDDSTLVMPYAAPGGQMTYVVSVTTQGCIATDTITILLDSTVLVITADTICQGDSGIVSVSSNTAVTSYLWSPTLGLSDTAVQSPMAAPNMSATYYVDVTNTNGCVFSDSVEMIVDTMPLASYVFAISDLNVLFTNNSINATSYSWDFGDGFLANVSDPDHTYNANGTYNVCLVAVNACGTDTSCSTVTVALAGCLNTVAAFDTASVELTAVFTDASTDVVNWAWDFGDGGTSGAQNPVHIYTAPGTYTVCLITSNPCSSDTLCVMVTITSSAPCFPTAAGFTSNSIGLDAVFTDGSSNATSWAWDFGDGNTSSAQSPVNTYPGDGTFNVCLITLNACSSDTTCANVTVAAAACPPATAGFTAAPFGLDVAFTDASIDATGWVWDFGDSVLSMDQNPSHIYDSAGTYTVCLTVNNPCSVDTFCTTVTVLACTTPVAAFTSSDNSLTVDFTDGSTNVNSWSWDFGDGNTSSAQNPTYVYSSSGSYTVCLTANSLCETDVVCTSVTVTFCPDVTAAFTFSDTLLDVYFTDISANATTWSWDFGDSATSVLQNPSHTYSSPGNYNVCLTSSSSCTSDVNCFAITIVTVGVDEENVEAKMEVYPNPTDGILNVSVPKNLGHDMTLSVYNVVGELVFRAQQSELTKMNSSKDRVQYSLQLGFLANGSYLLKVQSEDKLFMEQVIFSR